MRTAVAFVSARPPRSFTLQSPDMSGWAGVARLRALAMASTTPRTVPVDIANTTAGSTLSSPNLPSGATLNSAARTIAFLTAGTFTFTLVETLSTIGNSPRSSSVTIAVSQYGPVLAALSLPARGSVGAAQPISHATNGSVLTASSLPAGVTLNSLARTLTFSQPGSYSIGLIEAFDAAQNTPNPTTVTIYIVPNTRLTTASGNPLTFDNGGYILQEPQA